MKRYNNNILKSFRAFTMVLLGVIGLMMGSCVDINSNDPYSESVKKVVVAAVYPKEYASYVREGVVVRMENISTGMIYEKQTDKNGKVETLLPEGFYRVQISDKCGTYIFNGIIDKIKISKENEEVKVFLSHSKSGSLVIKEIYSSGCQKYPQEGNYQSDKYFIIHNNDSKKVYLDGLCFGTLFPFNSNATNPWLSINPETGGEVLPDFVPINEAIWQFGGGGEDFPLEPGEDAVIVVNGAVDHTQSFPQSVNLNSEDYFVCYNSTYFNNPNYHPAPGKNIRKDHILNVVKKLGSSTAYVLSFSSPVLVLFRPKGETIQDFLNKDGNIVQVPGRKILNAAIPYSWLIDAVEVFDGRTTSNKKRLLPSADAGFAVLTSMFMRHTVCRKVDRELSAKEGFEILMDTNNSTNDFYESEVQSLADRK